MTTTIKVEAHCSEDKEVIIRNIEKRFERDIVLKNGEDIAILVYDKNQILIFEQLKPVKRI